MLFRPRRANVGLEAELADPVIEEVLASILEADLVRTAFVLRVAELDAVVFPEANFADLVGSAWRLAKRQKAATWAGVAASERRISRGEIVGRFDESSRPLTDVGFEKVDENVVDVAAGDWPVFAANEVDDPTDWFALVRAAHFATVGQGVVPLGPGHRFCGRPERGP